MTKEQYALAEKRLKLAASLQFTLPGIPMIYYGDEAGVEGYHDPFCRKPFPWGRENKELLSFYTKLAHIKREQTQLHNTPLKFICCDDCFVVYTRGDIIVAVNVGNDEKVLDLGGKKRTELLSGLAEEHQSIIHAMSVKIFK